MSFPPLRDLMLAEFDREMGSTRKLLERVPEDRLAFQPHAKSMTLGRLAGHTAELAGFAAYVMQTEGLDMASRNRKPFAPQSSRELLESFDKFVAEGHAAIASATEEQLAGTWTLKSGEKTIFSLPRMAALRGMIMNHHIHHRGQLGVYLRLNDVAFPGMYGPSADDKATGK